MDPVSLAAAAMAVLSPYIIKAGEATASELAKQGLGKAEALLQALWVRWKGKPEQEKRLQDFVADPVAAKSGLESTLAVEIATDSAFAAELKKLLDGGRPEVFVRLFAKGSESVTGADIRNMLHGRVNVELTLDNVRSGTGFKADELG